MPKSIKPLSKSEWDSFNDKNRWDIFVALRGPDLAGKKGHNLKFLTSAVIRAKVLHLVRGTGGSMMINPDLPCVVVPTSAAKDGDFDASHFLGHVHDAAGLLDIPIVYVDHNVYWDLIGISSNLIERLKEAAQKTGYSVWPA